jgi:pimeloyl-ACP methyl ester carboxylesterase
MSKFSRIAFVSFSLLALVVAGILVAAAIWRSVVTVHLAKGSQVVQTARGPIEYSSLGEGPAVLVLHGSLGGYDQGLLIARASRLQGFKYIAISRPGYLRTPLKSGPTFEAQADLYVALLDALHIDKAAILAYSAGGHSAITFALQHPNRCWGLVLLSAHTLPLPLPPSSGAVKEAIAAGVLKSSWFSWMMSSALHRNPGLISKANLLNLEELKALEDPAMQPAMLRFFDASFPIGMRWTGLIDDLQQMAASPVYPLERIQTPTIVFAGTADPAVHFADAEANARAIARAQLVAIEKGGHLACIVRAAEVQPRLAEFLTAHTPPS